MASKSNTKKSAPLFARGEDLTYVAFAFPHGSTCRAISFTSDDRLEVQFADGHRAFVHAGDVRKAVSQ